MLPHDVPQDLKDGITAAVGEMTFPAKWTVEAVYVPARTGYEFKIKYQAKPQPSSGRIVLDDASNIAPEPPLSGRGVAARDVVRDLLAWHNASV